MHIVCICLYVYTYFENLKSSLQCWNCIRKIYRLEACKSRRISELVDGISYVAMNKHTQIPIPFLRPFEWRCGFYVSYDEIWNHEQEKKKLNKKSSWPKYRAGRVAPNRPQRRATTCDVTGRHFYTNLRRVPISFRHHWDTIKDPLKFPVDHDNIIA